MGIFENTDAVERYEAWFKKHKVVFESEIAALRTLIPQGKGFEIGIGTGLFAEKLDIKDGNDISAAMLTYARKRGCKVYECDAENLPIKDATYDFCLMVTTICFVKDPVKALKESLRILKPGGSIIVGFVDKESALGKLYYERASESVFYRDATFYSTQDVLSILQEAGFVEHGTQQTLFGLLDTIKVPQSPRSGSGEGGFVVVRGVRT